MVRYPSCRLGHIFFSGFFLLGVLEEWVHWSKRANSLTPMFEFASWDFPFLLGAIGIFIFIFFDLGVGKGEVLLTTKS